MTSRVLHIISAFHGDGAAKQLDLLAAGLPRDQFELQVCALAPGDAVERIQFSDVPVTVVGKSWKLGPRLYWRLRSYIRNLAPDIVHTWSSPSNCFGRQAAISAGVEHVIGSERTADRGKTWRRAMVDRYLARRTQRIVANSQWVRDYCIGCGLPAEKVVVIADGVSPAAPGKAADRAGLLVELGLPPESRLIAAIGNLAPYNRMKDLIWAAELLKVIRDDAHLLIIGDGPQRWRLERYCGQLQVRDRVHFLGQRLDISRLLPHLDCFWASGGSENRPDALMDAMAAGAPVVAADVEGVRDFILPRQTGYLVPLGDRAAFARWTNVLLNERDAARRLGQDGRAWVLEHFPVEKMVQQHAALYRQVIDSRRATPNSPI